jgi:signal transduction histidine kinase
VGEPPLPLKDADVHFASRVALQSLRVVLAFALTAMAALVAERLIFQRNTAESWSNIQAISESRASILLNDEELTMSAVAYAQSGDQIWRQRYNEAVSRFEDAVTKVKTLVASADAKQFEQDINEAHQAMAQLEQLVLDLTENGERADAVNVFTSPRYLKNKAILASTINNLVRKAEDDARAGLAKAQTRALWFVATAILAAILGFTWLSRRLRRALGNAETQFEKSQNDYLEQLAANHEAKLRTSRMEQIGSLTATMAHELRNPLGAVRTSTFMLVRIWPNRDERVDRAFARINSGVERCDNLITQLLDFSNLGDSEKRTVDFDTWLETTLHDMASALNASIELTCVLGAKGVKVDLDHTQMKQAVTKLLINASEAMISAAGDRETTNKDAPQIKITTVPRDGTLVLSLQDNGHGIRDEDLPRLTEPFFTTKSFGAGLGLPTVQRIVEQHRGVFSIQSANGAGAVVTIELPAA